MGAAREEHLLFLHKLLIYNGAIRLWARRDVRRRHRVHDRRGIWIVTGKTRPHSSRRTGGAIPKELLLRIAADLQGVTRRIAEIKDLCEWQLSDFGDTVLAAASIRDRLDQDPQREVEPGFQALIDEMAALHRRLERHVATGHEIAQEFLGVARTMARELEAVKGHFGARARSAAIAAAGAAAAGDASIISLQDHRAAKGEAVAVNRRAEQLSQSLRLLEASIAVLFQAQVQSGTEVASLRQRMQAYQRSLSAAAG